MKCYRELAWGEGVLAGILVIKLGALGDFIQACGPFKAIREHHSGEKITLLTTKPFASIAMASDYFDSVWVDERPSLLQLGAWLRLRRRLKSGYFTRVYDLQTSDRTALYYRLFGTKSTPEWSGIAENCSHPHWNPRRDHMHTLDRQSEQLRDAGVTCVLPPELNWLGSEIAKFELSGKYALLVPGGSVRRGNKRWPPHQFKELAQKLTAAGLRVALIGQASEAVMHSDVADKRDGVISLAGATTLAEVAALGRSATVSIGNDTGPMHILAAGGRPTFVLFGGASDPALCAPRGENVRCLISRDHGPIEDLSVRQVWEAVGSLVGSA